MKKIDWPGCRVIRYGENYKDNEEEYKKWLEIRRGFIGGSDAGSFSPTSKYKSPFLLYAAKKGKGKPFEGNAATKRGNLLEPVIRSETAKEIGAEIKLCPYALINNERPFMGCNLDGFINHPFDYDGKRFDAPTGFEAKTSRDGSGFDKASGEIPDDYYYQVQHCMAVTGIQNFIVSVYVVSRDELQIYVVPRNEEFINALVEAEAAFWHNNIEKDVTPAPRGLDGENDLLDEQITGGEVELTEELEELCRNYDKAKKLADEAAAMKNEAAAKIKAAMIAAQTGEGGKLTAKNERISLSYSVVKSTRIDSEQLKKNFPPIWEAVSKTTESGRLTVRIKEVTA